MNSMIEDVIAYVRSHRDIISQKVANGAIGAKISVRLEDMIRILDSIAHIESKQLFGTFENEDRVNVEHLRTQLYQNVDLLIQETPREALAWLLSFLMRVVLRI